MCQPLPPPTPKNEKGRGSKKWKHGGHSCPSFFSSPFDTLAYNNPSLGCPPLSFRIQEVEGRAVEFSRQVEVSDPRSADLAHLYILTGFNLGSWIHKDSVTEKIQTKTSGHVQSVLGSSLISQKKSPTVFALIQSLVLNPISIQSSA